MMLKPPEIINFSASSVPVLQLGVSGPGMSEQQLNDLALNFLRTQLIRVPGAVIPLPYGGKSRQVMINMDQNLMQAKNVSPSDVLNSVNAQNLILPSGTAKIAESMRSAIDGVVREAVIAAALTGVMILLFIGSWRSTLIIAISIPLSILSSILVLSFLHETINIMTLGGLALAVGILVDDATVEIENINRIIEEGRETEIRQAILDGAQQIAVPALVSTLCICIALLTC
jgi:multidrug efflux pump subunit AcrB